MVKSPKKKQSPRFTAASADRHVLYQLAVQNVEAEIDFVDETYKDLRGTHATSLREDFCGTGNTCCEWVKRRQTNTAAGLDLDQPTLDWGLAHNLSMLTPEQASRVSLINRDVLSPGDCTGFDAILAMNFSYWIFKTRQSLLAYFKSIHESLNQGGILFLDFYGGYESCQELREERNVEDDLFTYIWDQASFNPITHEMTCNIDFEFNDGSKLKKAFTYHWRLWSLPEIRELLLEAGFARSTVYWEGDDEDDIDDEGNMAGNGIFEPAEAGEPCATFICYIVAER